MKDRATQPLDHGRLIWAKNSKTYDQKHIISLKLTISVGCKHMYIVYPHSNITPATQLDRKYDIYQGCCIHHRFQHCKEHYFKVLTKFRVTAQQCRMHMWGLELGDPLVSDLPPCQLCFSSPPPFPQPLSNPLLKLLFFLIISFQYA